MVKTALKVMDKKENQDEESVGFPFLRAKNFSIKDKTKGRGEE